MRNISKHNYEPVIGLEIHAQLKTKTKLFCYSKNDPDEIHPNINICPICISHPGTLPVINEEAVKKVILVGLALNGEIAEFSQFDRKNYFYPDLPKGYQISQYKHPFVQGGALTLSSGRTIRVTRVHLEEDAGRLVHGKESGASLVDFNRAGVPLMELVTEPDFRTGDEVKEFGEKLQQILRYIGASDADMEKGQMRVEVNISLHKEGEPFGTKVEIKNINSFKFAADAANYEIQRQAEVLKRGEKIIQETRGWDDHKNGTFPQRSKEEAHDYRYFPEPDLPPLEISREYVAEVRASLPELPEQKKKRFMELFGLDEPVVEILIREKAYADYFESAVSEVKQHDKAARYAAGEPRPDGTSGRETPEKPKKNPVTLLASVMTGDLLRILRDVSASITEVRVTPENLAELVIYFAEDKISNLAAKEVLEEMVRTGNDPSDVIEKKGLWQMSDTADLEGIVKHIVEHNPKAIADYKNGKEASLQFLVGQVMKDSRGKANPKVVGELIKRIMNQEV